jgi:hypothetical protein
MVMMMVTNNKPKKWEIFVVVEVGFVNDVVVFLKNLMFFFFSVIVKNRKEEFESVWW